VGITTKTGKKMKTGKVYIAGAGCGDFELMTLKLKMLIEEAECIIYDRLVNKEILALAPKSAELIYYGKDNCEGGLIQEKINATLIEKAKEGKNVLRLKGGHPFVFGRGGEEALDLVDAGIEFEIIPGVTSAISVPAYAGIPISHRGINTSFHVFTGHSKDDGEKIDFETVSKLSGTLVFLMGIKNIEMITSNLVNFGKISSTPVAVIENGSTCHQRTVVGNLETISKIVEENHIQSPSIIIIGDVVNLREKLAWFEHKALHGHKVLVTSEKTQAKVTSRLVRSLGGESVECPFFTLDKKSFTIPRLINFDTVLFTSPQSLHAFFEKIEDIRQLLHLRIGVAGEKTKEALNTYKLQANIYSNSYRTQELLNLLTEKEEKVLLVRSTSISAELAVYSQSITELETYYVDKVLRSDEEVIAYINDVDIIAFPNACTVKTLIDSVGREILATKLIIASNENTALKIKSYGLHVNAFGNGEITEETFKTCMETEHCIKGKKDGVVNRRNKGFTHSARAAS